MVAGYLTDVAYAIRRESGNRFLTSVGRGVSQQQQQWYNRPTQTGSVVRFLGEGFYVHWLPNANVHLVEIDSDHWKSWVHQRLSTPMNRVRAMAFFQASPTEHLSFAKHLTTEVKTEEFMHSRYVVEARFYFRENLDILIDSLLRAWAMRQTLKRSEYADIVNRISVRYQLRPLTKHTSTIKSCILLEMARFPMSQSRT